MRRISRRRARSTGLGVAGGALAALGAASALSLAWASLVERNWSALREVNAQVLDPDA
jgi:hypothetical protein